MQHFETKKTARDTTFSEEGAERTDEKSLINESSTKTKNQRNKKRYRDEIPYSLQRTIIEVRILNIHNIVIITNTTLVKSARYF